jgi:hypothetical protein
MSQSRQKAPLGNKMISNLSQNQLKNNQKGVSLATQKQQGIKHFANIMDGRGGISTNASTLGASGLH